MRKRFLILSVILCLIFSAVPTMAVSQSYDENIDYMAKMYSCAKVSTEQSMALGTAYEQQRNLKIQGENIKITPTYFFNGESGKTVLPKLDKYIKSQQPSFAKYYTNTDTIMLAKVAYCESRGIKSRTEIACVMWTILNRVDDSRFPNSIRQVILQPNQFAYSNGASTISDYGYDLKILAYDVLNNWSKEKAGRTDYVRPLPGNYCWYAGRNGHNYFRTAYSGGSYWNYAWGHPYG